MFQSIFYLITFQTIEPILKMDLGTNEPGSFPVSWLFTSDGQSIGDSASASVLPMNVQG